MAPEIPARRHWVADAMNSRIGCSSPSRTGSSVSSASAPRASAAWMMSGGAPAALSCWARGTPARRPGPRFSS